VLFGPGSALGAQAYQEFKPGPELSKALSRAQASGLSRGSVLEKILRAAPCLRRQYNDTVTEPASETQMLLEVWDKLPGWDNDDGRVGRRHDNEETLSTWTWMTRTMEIIY